MTHCRSSEIAVWIDQVQSLSQSGYTTPPESASSDDKENTASRKRRAMQSDQDQTPRPRKRLRDVGDTARLPPPSPTSAISEAASDSVELESHHSGRLSPIKQIQLLEDLEDNPIVFCNFDDDNDGSEPEDVAIMRRAAQRLADGVGVLGYDDLATVMPLLSATDKERYRYSWATDLGQRSMTGAMPTVSQILAIVQTAREHDRGSGASEDDWNIGVQHPLLQLACSTSRHSKSLAVLSVKTAKIEPTSLSRSMLPARVVDYVVALKEEQDLKRIYQRLTTLPGAGVKSWNHTTRIRKNPIAIHIETKGPSKSWTDGKPQIALWVDAFLKRLSLLRNDQGDWPAIPLIIAQGHDWHLLIVSKRHGKMSVWDKIAIGSTRSCFDAMKVVATLHWLMDWAQTVWRPWLLSCFRHDE